MDYRSSLVNIKLFLQRYQISLFFSLVAVLSSYLLLPLGASYLLSRGLTAQGYERVIVQLGYPGLWGIDIPVISLQQDLGGETLSVSITNAEIRYRVPKLLRGHVDRVVLPDVSIQLLNTLMPKDDGVEGFADEEGIDPHRKVTTVGDVLHRVPVLPFEELILDRVTIFREEATGPLRKVTVSGMMTNREGELEGHLSFQGQDTASYGLTLASNSASSWSALLVSQRLQAVPIVSWRSQAHPNGPHLYIDGELDVNVRELAPFIALLVPIGPELEKVTGRITLNWSGTAATDAALASLWYDPSSRIEGHIQAHITLPALKGFAKDVALSYQGTFSGNAMQAEWALEPGVPIVATIESRPSLIHEAVRTLLPIGDQALRVEHSEPVRGILYWAESPPRLMMEGPLHITYGTHRSQFLVELEARQAEWAGQAFLSGKGSYRITGVFPKPLTRMLSADHASAELQGTLDVTREHMRMQILPSSFVTAKQIELGAMFIPHITLQFADTLSLQCDPSAVRCSTGPSSFAVRLPLLRVMGREIRVAHGALTLQLAEHTPDSWHAQGKLAFRKVSPDLVPWSIPPTAWKIRFLANQAGIKADIHIDTPFQESLVVAEIDQPLGPGKSLFHGQIGPIDFDDDEHRLTRLVAGFSPSLEIIKGRLEISADGSWLGGIGRLSDTSMLTSGTATIVVDKLSGRYGETIVKDVTTTVTLQSTESESIATREPASVTVGSVHTGISVTNIFSMVQGRWSFTENQPVIEVNDFRCEVLGGTVTSPGLVADFSAPPYRMPLSLENLDLSKILSVEQNAELQGTGTLHGTLPVSFTPEGIIIQEGTIAASPQGGVIRYRSTLDSSKAVSESGTQLRLVTDALNNFHYTVLQVGVDYAENGTLFLSARLEGKNPDLKKVPPINFNLTVQEHIPTLLKSLRLVEGLEQAMEEHYIRP